MSLLNLPFHTSPGGPEMDKKNKRTQVVLHMIACLAFVALPVVSSPFGNYNNIFSDSHIFKDILGSALTVVFFYINYYYLIPKYYFAKKYYAFGLYVLLGFIITTAIPNFVFHPDYHGGPPQFGQFHNRFPGQFYGPPGDMPSPPHHNIIAMMLNHAVHNLLRFMLVFFISLMMKINTRYKAVQKEKISSELSYLKAQINPHFLFNTLNSIYSLAVKKSDKTPDAIVALSGMMRYVLNEADNELVPLEKELDYIRSYIDLQTNRFGNTLHLSLDIHTVEPGQQVAPLILISFIENAFKYGVNPQEDSKISITIQLHNNELMFRVTNNIVTVRSSDVEQTGIGLENTLARLQLLYPARHNITITEDDKEYAVLLILKLV